MSVTDNSVKILVCGDVNGNIKALVMRVNKILKSSGDFQCVFCVGNFFGDSNGELDQLIGGDLITPIPIYIVSHPDASNTYIKDMNGCDLTSNVHYLGKQGLFSGISGLRVVYAVTNEAKSFERPKELDLSHQKSDKDFIGVDLLLTTEWPMSFGNFCPELESVATLPKDAACSLSTSRLAYIMKPRYHFTASQGVYYERTPYRNHRMLVEKASHVTRFIALAGVKNAQNQKYIYAIKVTPIDSMNREELTAEPPLVTENPYLSIVEQKAPVTDQQQDGSQQFFYDFKTGRKTGAGTKHSRGRQDNLTQEEREANLQAKLARQNLADKCWFCLGNPKLEKHLICSVGNHAYVALPRGPLVQEHVLILTIGHHQNYVSSPPHVQAEIEAYKQALREYFRSKDQLLVCYERNYKTQHFIMQCVPVPFSVGPELRALFVNLSQACEDSPCELELLPKNASIDDICSKAMPYMYVELPNGERLFNTVSKPKILSSNINFARQVLADAKCLGAPEKINWRDCCDDEETETKLTQQFRQNFLPFEPKTD